MLRHRDLYVLTRIALAAACYIVLLSGAHAQEPIGGSFQFVQLEPGLDYASGVSTGPARVKVWAVRVNTRSHRVGLVVSSRNENGKTVSELQRSTGAKVVLSGGFMTSFLPAIPLGYVKDRGIVINRSAGGDLLTGVLGLRNGRVAIAKWSGFRAEAWDQCLQAGPLLLDEGHDMLPAATDGLVPSTRQLIDKSYTRSLVGYSPPDTFIMMVTEAVTLRDLTRTLRQELGPRIAALNLSGSNSAGLVVATSRRHELAGRDGLSVANAIVVDVAAR